LEPCLADEKNLSPISLPIEYEIGTRGVLFLTACGLIPEKKNHKQINRFC